MPFGKYAGVDVEDLPSEYLEWLTTIELRGRLKNKVRDEYDRRQRENVGESILQRPGLTITLKPQELPIMRRMVDVGYRQLSRSLHPDAGGDAEQMRMLNGLRDSVRGQLDLLELGV